MLKTTSAMAGFLRVSVSAMDQRAEGSISGQGYVPQLQVLSPAGQGLCGKQPTDVFFSG